MTDHHVSLTEGRLWPGGISLLSVYSSPWRTEIRTLDCERNNSTPQENQPQLKWSKTGGVNIQTLHPSLNISHLMRPSALFFWGTEDVVTNFSVEPLKYRPSSRAGERLVYVPSPATRNSLLLELHYLLGGVCVCVREACLFVLYDYIKNCHYCNNTTCHSCKRKMETVYC